MSDSFESVIDQMGAAGIDGLLASDLISDGLLHRFQPQDSKSKTAWYRLFEYHAKDGSILLYGRFGDWRFHGPEGIKVEPPDRFRLSDAEREEFRKIRDRKQRVARNKKRDQARRAALRAKRLWDRLSDKGESPYLVRKSIQGYGARYSPKKALVIPLVDMGDALHGLQVIHAEPVKVKGGDEVEKQFFPYGMDPRGHFHLIGKIPASGRVVIVVCEGYATGASIHQASGWPVVVAFNAGNLSPVVKAFRDTYSKAEIFIAADDDFLTTKPIVNPGVTLARKAAKTHRAVVIVPSFKNRDKQKWTDFNDLHNQDGIDAVQEQIDRAVDQGLNADPVSLEFQIQETWQMKLQKTQSGSFKADINNTTLVLQHDKDWAGVLGYCDFSYAVVKIKPPPFENNATTGEWSDEDTARLRVWIAQRYSFAPKTADTDDAVLVAAQDSRFHPVRDYLNGLRWDGTPRLQDWLSDYFGCEKNPYSMAVGEKWMIAAVARVMRPGCKMDHVLILEGTQGRGKSTALRILGGEFFSDTHFELGTKDAYQQMRGIWIYEMAELDAFNKAESTRAKAFFSATEDNYRPSYGRRNIRVPRQCIVAGSTNQDHYLKDVTGNRRYWPIFCHDIDLEALKKIRDQLWAEAVVQYNKGTPWRVLQEEWHLFADAQEDRYLGDAWEHEIAAWLNDVEQKMINHFTTGQIMKGALEMKKTDMRPPEQIRVGLIMKRLGWRKARKRDQNKDPRWYYERPDHERHDPADDPPV